MSISFPGSISRFSIAASSGKGSIPDRPDTVPVFTGASIITGNPVVGLTVTCVASGYTGYPTPILTYAWFLGEEDLDATGSVSPVLTSDMIGEGLICVVTATNVAGSDESIAGPSDPVEAAPTFPATPVAPTGLATGPFSGRFSFSEPFDGGSAITASEFRWSEDESDWTVVANPVPPVELFELPDETEIFGQTRFQNEFGWSNWSPSGSFTTELSITAPNAPAAPVGAALSFDSGTFTFSEPSYNGGSAITDSEFRWSLDEADWTVVDDPVSPLQIDDLPGSTRVFGQARYENVVGWGSWSLSGHFDTEVEPAVPGQPAAPVGTTIDHRSGSFAFAPPANTGSTGIDDHEFRWSLDESDWTVIDAPNSPVIIADQVGETQVFSQVRYHNTVGWGDWSASGSFETDVAPTPDYDAHIFAVGHSLISEHLPEIGRQIANHGWDYQLIGGAPLRVQWQDHDGEGTYPLVGDSVDSWVFFATGVQTHVILCENHNIDQMIMWEDAEGYAVDFYNLAYTGNPATIQFYYQCWPSANGSAPDWDWDDFATEVAAQRQYYEQVAQFVELNKAGGPRFLMIPAASALVALKSAIDATDITGISDFGDLFSDDVHPDNATGVLWYYLACLIYACVEQETPVGLPYTLTGYSGPTETQAAELQALAWTVASTDRWAGIATAPTAPGDQNEPTLEVDGTTSVTVTYSAPASNGGSVIIQERLRYSVDAGATWTTVTGTTSPQSITGLPVVADVLVETATRNAIGWSGWSPAAEIVREPSGEAVMMMSLEFDLEEYEIDGDPVTTSGIGFDRSTSAYYWTNGFGVEGTITDLAVGVPQIEADGILLRGSGFAQYIPDPAVAASFSQLNGATRSASAITYSGMTGQDIASGGNVNARSGRYSTGLTTSVGATYRCKWIYKLGTGTVPRVSALLGSSQSSIGYSGGTWSSILTNAGTWSDISDTVLDAANGVRMVSAVLTSTVSGSGLALFFSPYSATVGQTITGFGVNVHETTAQTEFDKLQQARGAESLMPPLPDGTYDVVVVGPDNTEEWRYGAVWASGVWDGEDWLDESETPVSTSPTAPISGDDRIKRIYAYTEDGGPPDPTAPATPDAPTGTAISDTEGQFSFTVPSDGGSAITAAELRWSDDQATWTTITGATSPEALTGLDPETLYYGQTRFQNAVGWSSWSASGTFTTEEEVVGGEPYSIWGFQRPAVPPTVFPGELIVGTEQDGTDTARWSIQSNDPALSINPGNFAASGAQTTSRYIGYTDENAAQVGDRIAIIAEIASASGNMAVTSNMGNSSNSSNTRIGHKQGVITANAAVAPRMSVTFNTGVVGHFARMRAYNLRILLDRPWFIVFTAGQSNGVCSVATADPSIDTPIEGVVVFPGLTNPYTGAQSGLPMMACEPIQHQTLNGSSGQYGGGPMGECLREIRKRIPDTFTVVCVPLNWAGQGFKTNGYWNKESAVNTAYTNFWTRLRAVWAQAPEGSIMGGFFFCGGESDLGSGNLDEWVSLTTGVPALINEIRSEPDWGDVPVVMMEIGMDNSLSNVQAMIALQSSLATGSGEALEFELCRYVPRPLIWATVDGTHYDQATHRIRGHEAALALLDMIYDGAPPPPDPDEDGVFTTQFTSEFS